MNASATKQPSTFVKVREDGSYDYGYTVRVGRRDRLDVVGTEREFADAQGFALSLPHKAA